MSDAALPPSPDPAPLAPSSGRGTSGLHGLRGSAVTMLLLVAVLSCWAAAIGRYGGPDEPAHVVRAHAVAHGDLLGAPAGGLPPGYRSVTVPASLGTGDPACYRHDPGRDSSCAAASGGGEVTVATAAGTNPPLYYALVGLPARAIGRDGDPLAYRLAAVVLVALVSALTAHRLVRVRRAPAGVDDTASPSAGATPAIAGLAVVTPSCWYLWGVVNPNALEIALVALATVGVVRGRGRPSTSDAWWVATPLALAIAMRPVAVLWVVGLLVVAEVEWRPVAGRLRAVTWGLPAVAVAGVVGWSRWSAWVVSDERTAGNGSRLDALRDSVGGLPRTGAELVSSMGWLEYRAPWPAILAWAAAVAVVARTRPRADRWSWIVLAVALVLVPVAFEVVLYERIGLIWQGRYLLPVAAAVVVLAVAAPARPAGPRTLRVLVGLGAITVTTTFWAASRRAAVGTDGSWFFHDAVRTSRVLGPGTWVLVHTTLVVVCAALLLRRINSSAPAGSIASDRTAALPHR